MFPLISLRIPHPFGVLFAALICAIFFPIYWTLTGGELEDVMGATWLMFIGLLVPVAIGSVVSFYIFKRFGYIQRNSLPMDFIFGFIELSAIWFSGLSLLSWLVIPGWRFLVLRCNQMR